MEQFELPPRFGSVQLSQEQINLRQNFVSEYLKDLDGIKACLRLGYNFSYAKDASKNLLQDPYVQYILSSRSSEAKSTPEMHVDGVRSRNQSKAALMHIINCGHDEKAIVAALKLKFQLDREESSGSGEKASGVMVVPGVVDISTWEKAAMESQELLQRVSSKD